MTLDREALAKAILPTLTATGHYVDVAQRPADAPAGTPHAILWPQPSVSQTAMASGFNVDDVTVMQVTSVAPDRYVAMRVSADMRAAFAGLPSTLAGRHLVSVQFVFESGPTRDPDDRDVWFCVLQPSVETWPA